MFIDINEIERDGIVFDRRLELSGAIAPGPDLLRVKSARMEGRAERDEQGVVLRARMDAKIELACGRCTEPFDVDLALRFELTLVPDAAEFAAGEARIGEDDASLFYTREGKADLIQVAAEQIYLNLPLKPVCQNGCKGLCPNCGANRNVTECGCTGESIDPRLAPLLQFKKRR
jgi:uncharacterized protein